MGAGGGGSNERTHWRCYLNADPPRTTTPTHPRSPPTHTAEYLLSFTPPVRASLFARRALLTASALAVMAVRDISQSLVRAGTPRLVEGSRNQSVTNHGPSREARLQQALDDGIIDQANHDRQLRELRAQSEFGGGGVLLAPPTRVHGDNCRLDLKDQWYTVVATPFATKAAALAAVKKKQVVHGNNGGDWKYNCFKTGGGSNHHLRCAGHKGCPVLMRIQQLPSGEWAVQVTTRVMHNAVEECWDRVNSPLSKRMRDEVEELFTLGYTPKEAKESLLASVVAERGDDCKDPSGGVTGEPPYGHAHAH